MDIRRLEVFCKVVELKSFTKAAEAVHLSQPTVSEHIRLLEEGVGERLLDRLGREVLPSPAGNILYQYARRIIRLRDEAIASINHFKGHLAGELVIGASSIPGSYILPELLVAFTARYPEIRPRLRISDTGGTVEELLKGHLELGVIGARWQDQRLECQPLFSDQLVLCVHPGHRWAGGTAVAPSVLREEPFIMRERGSGTRMMLSEALQGQGVNLSELEVVAELGSTEAVRQCVKAGLGVSILSSLAVRDDLHQGSLVQVPLQELEIRREFYLVQRRGRQLSPLAETFKEHLQHSGAAA